MNAHEDEVLRESVEREVRSTVGLGGSPACTIEEVEAYEPKGPNAWFGYVIGEVASLVTLRRMSETWQVTPPLPDWRCHAPAIRRHFDELTMTAQLPHDMTLASWYHQNEPMLRQDPLPVRDPDTWEPVRTVAVALVPLFEAYPECWEAVGAMDSDFSRGSFANFLAEWQARAPEKCRGFVERVADEFGLEIGE